MESTSPAACCCFESAILDNQTLCSLPIFVIAVGCLEKATSAVLRQSQITKYMKSAIDAGLVIVNSTHKGNLENLQQVVPFSLGEFHSSPSLDFDEVLKNINRVQKLWVKGEFETAADSSCEFLSVMQTNAKQFQMRSRLVELCLKSFWECYFSEEVSPEVSRLTIERGHDASHAKGLKFMIVDRPYDLQSHKDLNLISPHLTLVAQKLWNSLIESTGKSGDKATLPNFYQFSLYLSQIAAIDWDMLNVVDKRSELSALPN